MQRPRLSPEQIATIRDSNGSCRATAAAVGCSKSAVAYHWQKMADDLDGPDAGNMIEFARLRVPRKCERHGPTNVWPCVRCAAEMAIFDR